MSAKGYIPRGLFRLETTGRFEPLSEGINEAYERNWGFADVRS